MNRSALKAALRPLVARRWPDELLFFDASAESWMTPVDASSSTEADGTEFRAGFGLQEAAAVVTLIHGLVRGWQALERAAVQRALEKARRTDFKPVIAELERELVDYGLDPDVAAEIAGELGENVVKALQDPEPPPGSTER